MNCWHMGHMKVSIRDDKEDTEVYHTYAPVAAGLFRLTVKDVSSSGP